MPSRWWWAYSRWEEGVFVRPPRRLVPRQRASVLHALAAPEAEASQLVQRWASCLLPQGSPLTNCVTSGVKTFLFQGTQKWVRQALPDPPKLPFRSRFLSFPISLTVLTSCRFLKMPHLSLRAFAQAVPSSLFPWWLLNIPGCHSSVTFSVAPSLSSDIFSPSLVHSTLCACPSQHVGVVLLFHSLPLCFPSFQPRACGQAPRAENGHSCFGSNTWPVSWLRKCLVSGWMMPWFVRDVQGLLWRWLAGNTWAAAYGRGKELAIGQVLFFLNLGLIKFIHSEDRELECKLVPLRMSLILTCGFYEGWVSESPLGTIIGTDVGSKAGTGAWRPALVPGASPALAGSGRGPCGEGLVQVAGPGLFYNWCRSIHKSQPWHCVSAQYHLWSIGWTVGVPSYLDHLWICIFLCLWNKNVGIN